jgi:hypothetical protein
MSLVLETKRRVQKGETGVSGEIELDQNRRSGTGSSTPAFSSRHSLKNLLPSSSV